MAKVSSIILLSGAAIALVSSFFGLYVVDHNALDTCIYQPPPVGALPFEAGYAGHSTAGFPVAGVLCSWNAPDGSTFTTLAPNVGVTAGLWSAIVLTVAGLALLVWRARGSR